MVYSLLSSVYYATTVSEGRTGGRNRNAEARRRSIKLMNEWYNVIAIAKPVMYGPVCSPSRGPPPSVLLDFGRTPSSRWPSTRLISNMSRETGRLGRPVCGHANSKTDGRPRVWGFSTGMFSVRAGRRARARLSFLRWPVQLGGRPGASLTSIYASDHAISLAWSRRARFGLHITVPSSVCCRDYLSR